MKDRELNSDSKSDGKLTSASISAKKFTGHIPRLLELVNDLVFSITPDAKVILYLNPAAEKIYGRSSDEIKVNNGWLNFIHGEDQAGLQEKLANINVTKGFDIEYRIVQPDGQFRYMHGNFRRILNEQHQLLAIGCIAKDITSRIRAENELEESQAIYHSLVESLPINVFRKDREGRMVFVNQKYCETIGLEREELLGKTDFDLFDVSMSEKYLKDDKWVLQTGLPFHDIEFHQREGTEEYKYVEILKAPVNSANGRRIGIQGMFWDVTDRKKAEIELEKAKDVAVAASRAKSDFLANVSHEIRTPLNAVIGMTDLLLGMKNDVTQREYLKMIRDSGQSLLSLINDILDFAKIESGKLNIDAEWFDLRRKTGDILASLAFKAHEKNVDLIIDFDPTIPTQVLGDCQRLRQVIVNLVGNSIKFTDRGEIVVSVRKDRGQTESLDIKFLIRDTGIGIPDEKLAKIFEEFEQGDTSTTRKYGGSGLGLAIASSLVELMGGNLQVASSVGEGTTFHFTLNFGVGTNQTLPQIPNEFAKHSVLVVTNNESLRDSLKSTMSFWRMEVFTSSDLDESLNLIRGMAFAKQAIQTVVVDARLKLNNGASPAENVKQLAIGA